VQAAIVGAPPVPPLTVMGALAWVEPKRLRAVSVYVTVAAGVTDCVPCGETVPMPEISTESAFSTFQVSVDA
jgi:hypothetical protein